MSEGEYGRCGPYRAVITPEFCAKYKEAGQERCRSCGGLDMKDKANVVARPVEADGAEIMATEPGRSPQAPRGRTTAARRGAVKAKREPKEAKAPGRRRGRAPEIPEALEILKARRGRRPEPGERDELACLIEALAVLRLILEGVQEFFTRRARAARPGRGD